MHIIAGTIIKNNEVRLHYFYIKKATNIMSLLLLCRKVVLHVLPAKDLADVALRRRRKVLGVAV
jgi:hypothetical protein